MRKSSSNSIVDESFFEQYFNQLIQELKDIKTICQQLKEDVEDLKSKIGILENLKPVDRIADSNQNVNEGFSTVVPSSDLLNNDFMEGRERLTGNENRQAGCATAEVINDDIILNVVGEKYEKYAVFFICSNELETEVELNPKSIQFALGNAEVQLLPYFNIEYGQGTASSIETIDNGRAVWEDRRWVLKQKPKIRII